MMPASKNNGINELYPQQDEFGKTIATRFLKIKILFGYGDDTSASLTEIVVLQQRTAAIKEKILEMPNQKDTIAAESIL